MSHRQGKLFIGTFTLIIASAFLYALLFYSRPVKWTEAEIKTIRTLWIENLPELPQDPRNSVADNPAAATFGKKLFSDSRLSINGQESCSSCHRPDHHFTDGREKASAIGRSKRNAPSLIGVAYSPWLYWDGRKDSLWSQALSPLENPAEQGGNRLFYVHLLNTVPEFKKQYEVLFGPLPGFTDTQRFPTNAAPGTNSDWDQNWAHMEPTDQKSVNQVFTNLGKVLAAYERTLLPVPTVFDAYVADIVENVPSDSTQFSNEAAHGLRLFIGKARCTECHNGPLLTNNEFHNTGILSYPGELPDRGRIDAISQLQNDPFNCLGEYSDNTNHQCNELRYMRTGIELLGAFRTPSLRNLDGTAPYMHKGQIKTLPEVLRHYNKAPNAMIGHNEATPLNLSRRELRELEAFLKTLMTPVPAKLQ